LTNDNTASKMTRVRRQSVASSDSGWSDVADSEFEDLHAALTPDDSDDSDVSTDDGIDRPDTTPVEDASTMGASAASAAASAAAPAATTPSSTAGTPRQGKSARILGYSASGFFRPANIIAARIPRQQTVWAFVQLFFYTLAFAFLVVAVVDKNYGQSLRACTKETQKLRSQSQPGPVTITHKTIQVYVRQTPKATQRSCAEVPTQLSVIPTQISIVKVPAETLTRTESVTRTKTVTQIIQIPTQISIVNGPGETVTRTETVTQISIVKLPIKPSPVKVHGMPYVPQPRDRFTMQDHRYFTLQRGSCAHAQI
jgi:hypothetical protein